MSTNESDRQAHAPRGWAVVAADKRAWQEAAFYAWKEHRLGLAGEALGKPCTVTVHLGFHTNRRRDPHNYVGTVCKWIVDGLVMAGLWPDDNPEYVSLAEPVLVVHKRVPTNVPLPCEVHLVPREKQ
jgi:hypothetical protein